MTLLSILRAALAGTCVAAAAAAAASDGNVVVLASSMALVLAPRAMPAVKHKPEDLLGGQIDIAFLPLAAGKPLEGFEFDRWAGIFVSRKVPDAAADKLKGAILQVLQKPGGRNAYESSGNVIAKPTNVAALITFHVAEIARDPAIAKTANVQPQ